MYLYLVSDSLVVSVSGPPPFLSHSLTHTVLESQALLLLVSTPSSPINPSPEESRGVGGTRRRSVGRTGQGGTCFTRPPGRPGDTQFSTVDLNTLGPGSPTTDIPKPPKPGRVKLSVF